MIYDLVFADDNIYQKVNIWINHIKEFSSIAKMFSG